MIKQEKLASEPLSVTGICADIFPASPAQDLHTPRKKGAPACEAHAVSLSEGQGGGTLPLFNGDLSVLLCFSDDAPASHWSAPIAECRVTANVNAALEHLAPAFVLFPLSMLRPLLTAHMCTLKLSDR